MKLFECTYRKGYECFERYFDTDLNRSVEKRIDLPAEWYEESSKGLYTYILDESIKLEKKQGKAKDGREHYGFLDSMYRNIRDNYWADKSYNTEPRVWYLDIETRVTLNGFPKPENAAEQISLMQFYDTKAKTMFILGIRDWVHEKDYSFDYTVKYIKCKNEIHMLEIYLGIFDKLDPLIIYAWNGLGFDYPYIYNRMKKLGMCTDKLSNYGNTSLKQSEFNGRTVFDFKSSGHYYLDLQEIYTKFTFKPVPNYKLGTIAEIELKENKVSHPEYAAFDDFYSGKYIIPKNPTEHQLNTKIYKAAISNNWNEVKELAHSEFVYYGAIDTHLIARLDQKKQFTSMLVTIAMKMGVQIGDAMGTVKPWAQFLSNISHQKNQIMPVKKEHDKPVVVGGHVRECERGKHNWVLSADVNSMYPLLGMVGFNMSPETFVPKYKLPPELRDIILSYFNEQDEDPLFDYSSDIWNSCTELLQKHNLSLGINGAVFKKDKLGMIPELVLDIYNTRKKAKQKQFKYEQRKILIGELMGTLE